MKTLTIALCSLFFACPLFADSTPHGRASTSILTSSDEITLRTYEFEYKSTRRDFYWPYPEESDSKLDWSLYLRRDDAQTILTRVTQLTLLPKISKRFSENMILEGGAGLSDLDDEHSTDSLTFVPLHLKFYYKLDNKLFLTPHYEKAATVNDVKVASAFLRKDMVANKLLFLQNNFRFGVNTSYTWLNDKNEVYFHDVDIKYVIQNYPYWILIGVGTEYYRNKLNMPIYWTPRQFISVGPRFEVAIPFKEKFQFFFAGSVNRFQDENNNNGTGHYFNTGFKTDARDKDHFTIGFERVLSRQNSSDWYMNRPYIDMNLFF